MATCFEGFTFEIDFDFKTGAFVILFTERTAGGGELFDLLAKKEKQAVINKAFFKETMIRLLLYQMMFELKCSPMLCS